MSGLPTGLSWDGTKFVGSPAIGTEGLYTVTIDCTDNNGAMASTTFQLEICETTIVCPHWCEVIKAYSGGQRSCFTEITSCISTVDDLALGGTVVNTIATETVIDSPTVAGDFVLVNGPNGELFLYCLQAVVGTEYRYKIIQLVGGVGTGSPVGTVAPVTAGHTYIDSGDGCKWIFVSDGVTGELTDQRWYPTNCSPCPAIPLDPCGNIRKTVGFPPVIGDESDGDTYVTDIGVFEWQSGAWVPHPYLSESFGAPATPGLFAGQLVLNTIDGSTHRWNGTTWVVDCEIIAKDDDDEYYYYY